MNNIDQQKSKTFENLAQELGDQINTTTFLVFLCGPTLCSKRPSASALLRKRLKEELEKEHFGVVLGEDDGLEELRKKFKSDAQTNELHFVQTPECRVIIIIADSVGSHCELGLFNWHFANQKSSIIDKNKVKFYVIADENYKDDKSYFNNGPLSVLRVANGNIEYSNFDNFDIASLVKDLEAFRAIHLTPYKNGDA